MHAIVMRFIAASWTPDVVKVGRTSLSLNTPALFAAPSGLLITSSKAIATLVGQLNTGNGNCRLQSHECSLVDRTSLCLEDGVLVGSMVYHVASLSERSRRRRTRAKKACSGLFERLLAVNDLFPFFDSFLPAMPRWWQTGGALQWNHRVAILLTTAAIVVGGILAAASNGSALYGLFWMLAISRGIVGFGTCGGYPASSTHTSETATERTLEQRAPIFILVTNLPQSFGGPLAVFIFLIVLSAAVRVIFPWSGGLLGIGVLLPLLVFCFVSRG